MNNLPEYWVIEQSSNPLYRAAIKWINSTYKCNWAELPINTMDTMEAIIKEGQPAMIHCVYLATTQYFLL